MSVSLTLGSFFGLEAGKHEAYRPAGCSPRSIESFSAQRMFLCSSTFLGANHSHQWDWSNLRNKRAYRSSCVKVGLTSRVSESVIQVREWGTRQEFSEKWGSGNQHCSKVTALKLNPSQLYYTFSHEGKNMCEGKNINYNSCGLQGQRTKWSLTIK